MAIIDDYKLYEMEEELNRLRQMIRDIREVCNAPYDPPFVENKAVRRIKHIIQ
jgi:hypothetical protein